MRMKLKNLQLWLNQNYTSIKHWLVVTLGIMLLIFSMIVIAGQNRLIAQVKTLSEQNKALAKDNKTLNTQAKKLGEDNKSIAKQSRSFVLCGFQVFAEYTRDRRPIENLDLEACTTVSQSEATDNTSIEGTAPVSTSGGASSTTQGGLPSSSSSQNRSSSSQNNTTPAPSPANNSQPDNEGVIFNLPLVPEIRIPSPF